MKWKGILLCILAMIVFSTSAGASPLGYVAEEALAVRQDRSFSAPPSRLDSKTWLDVEIWISPDIEAELSESLFESTNKGKRTEASVTAYLFSYGDYLHEWEFPFFETETVQGLLVERPFEYKGPLPVPGYASGPVGGRFEYPYAQMFPQMKQGPVYDAFTQKYAPPEERSRFEYPIAPSAPKAAARPALPPASAGPTYSPPGGVSQGGSSQGGVPGGGQFYQYGVPGQASGYPSGQSPTERRLMEEQFRREKSRIEDFRQEVAVSRTVGKPYEMILLGAGLAALAAIFRMFRLSLFIMVGWLIFYGRDIWRIIVDLV